MRILKKFNSYIKEDLEMMANPATKPAPSTTPAPATPTIQPGIKPERRERPTPIRRDRPAIEPDPQAKMKKDATEEEGTYIGTEMLQDLADALGTEVMNNAVEYEGKKVNFYSETEMFHVDKKKFATVEEVVDYLTGGSSPKAQMDENDTESFEDELEEEVEDLEDEFEEDEELIQRDRYIKEFENFMYDDEDDSTDDFNQYEDDFEHDEGDFGDDYDDNEFYQSEEKCCPTCTCEPCECTKEEEFSEEDEKKDDFKAKKFDLKWKDASKSEIKSKILKGYDKYAF